MRNTTLKQIFWLNMLAVLGSMVMSVSAQQAVTSLTLSNNSGDANGEWIIQGERTLILNGFDTGPSNILKPYTINALTLDVTTPIGDAPVTVVVYEDPNGGSPVDATLIARTDVVLSSAGVARVVLPQPPTSESQIFWAGFYLPPNFAFNADQGGTSVLTYWAWAPGAEFDLNSLASAPVFGPSNGTAPVNIDLKGVARITAEVMPPVAQTAGFTPQTAPLGRQIIGDANTVLTPMVPYPECSTLLYDQDDVNIAINNRYRLLCRADVLQDIPGTVGTGLVTNTGNLAEGIRTFIKGGYVFDIFTSNTDHLNQGSPDGSATRLPTAITHCLQPAAEHLERAIIAVAYGAPTRWYILPTVRLGNTICAELTNVGLVTYLLPVNTDQQDIPLSSNLYFTYLPYIKDSAFVGCNQLNTIVWAVRNDGFEGPDGFNVDFTITHRRTGLNERFFTARVDEIGLGETIEIGTPVTLPRLYGRENYRVTITLDPANLVPELNEGDNTATFDFTLNKTGQCGKPK